MRMIVVALVGGVVLGFVDAKFLMGAIQKQVADPGMQGIVSSGVAAFLGALWGWIGKGVVGVKGKE